MAPYAAPDNAAATSAIGTDVPDAKKRNMASAPIRSAATSRTARGRPRATTCVEIKIYGAFVLNHRVDGVAV